MKSIRSIKNWVAPPKESTYLSERDSDIITCVYLNDDKGKINLCVDSKGDLGVVKDLLNKEEVAAEFGKTPQELTLVDYKRDYNRLKRGIGIGARVASSFGLTTFGIPVPDGIDFLIDVVDKL